MSQVIYKTLNQSHLKFNAMLCFSLQLDKKIDASRPNTPAYSLELRDLGFLKLCLYLNYCKMTQQGIHFHYFYFIQHLQYTIQYISNFNVISNILHLCTDQKMPGQLPASTPLSTLYPFCHLLSFYVRCLSYSSSPSIFSKTLPLFSPVLSLMDPSDPSLLKMCLFRSLAFKDVARVRQRPGNTLLSSCVCDSVSGEADQNDRDLVRPHQTKLPDASAYQRSGRDHISIICDLAQIMSQACLFWLFPSVFCHNLHSCQRHSKFPSVPSHLNILSHSHTCSQLPDLFSCYLNLPVEPFCLTHGSECLPLYCSCCELSFQPTCLPPIFYSLFPVFPPVSLDIKIFH